MSTELLSKEEKLRILKTLEVDEEFRYAIAGALGILTILEELKKLREDFNKRFELSEKRLEVIERRFEIVEKRFEEINKRFEAIEKSLEDLTRVVGELKVAVGSLGRMFGRDLEKTILELYRHVLAERGIEIEKVERFICRDVDGRFYKKGAMIEVDIYLHDKVVYFIEVKAYIELDDVDWFHDKVGIVEKILGRKADKLVIVAVNIDKNALERARDLGIEVVYGGVIE